VLVNVIHGNSNDGKPSNRSGAKYSSVYRGWLHRPINRSVDGCCCCIFCITMARKRMSGDDVLDDSDDSESDSDISSDKSDEDTVISDENETDSDDPRCSPASMLQYNQ